MKLLSTLGFLLILFLTCPGHGQVPKRTLTEQDYALWSTLSVGQLSDNGNWVHYSLRYESGNDTLFVKHTKTMKTYSFPKCSNGQFAEEKKFVCQDAAGHLLITDLTTGRRETVEAVTSYTISEKGRYIIFHKSTNELHVIDQLTKEKLVFPEIISYSYNSAANALLYGSKEKLYFLKLNGSINKEVVSEITGVRYSDFTWQKDGRSVAYYIDGATKKIGFYDIQKKVQLFFDTSQIANFPKNMELYQSSFTELTISDDGSKVFFGMKSTAPVTDSNGVQIWNTADRSVYPAKKLYDGMDGIPKIGVWFITQNRFVQLTDNEFPNAMLTGNQQYAVVYNPIANAPEFTQNPAIDFYLKNIATGQMQLLLSKQSADINKFTTSPNGRSIAYFKDKAWWIYTISNGVHTNITQSIPSTFEDGLTDRPGERPACGFVGWSADTEELLLYDDYDVWLVKADGSNFKRLTNGRNLKLRYRILPMAKENRGSVNFSWMQKGSYDLTTGLILKASNLDVNEIHQWNRVKGLSKLLSTQNRLDAITISKDKSTLVYTAEHYHQSPQLNVLNKKSKSRLIFQSNAHQQQFAWGFSKLVTYSSAAGEPLHGALFYPAGYSAEKLYPMIVMIYEKLAHNYTYYVNPTLLNDVGFNITNFTSQGYFVLLPEIAFKEGATGKSATECVVNACKEVLKNERVDPKRLGLIGHSFGGYETNFIITQTPLFAAAVSGSGVSDNVSDYLSVGWNGRKQNYWRYESDQYRIGVSLFEDRLRYECNSPMTFVENITTPLLLWSGMNDSTIHYFQGLEFHLALKRLMKPNILLLYENGRHLLKSKEDMMDLTHRMQDWFGNYLKGEVKPAWFTPDRL